MNHYNNDKHLNKKRGDFFSVGGYFVLLVKSCSHQPSDGVALFLEFKSNNTDIILKVMTLLTEFDLLDKRFPLKWIKLDIVE